uniref:Eukaryotic translation initiation factor 4 gamma 3 n=1 Tax=Tetraodon nigroviridis TaxID=99883 RepID=H3CBX3_TETNG
MNTQPPSRPFFPRTQMQSARPAIPTNTASLRPGSQPPTAAVYPTNQPIMMTMAPMPFPSPQPAQYYIPQYRHNTPYVGPPQQYSVQPPGSGSFYPGPGPGEYAAPYPGPPYYPGQTVYPPSPPIIVPTPQQPPPAKREKKTIRIRDPNQGGRDITEEIMAGGSGSRNSTPPGGHPSSTPTPPQQLSSSQSPEQPQPPQQSHPGSVALETPQPQQPSLSGAADPKPGPAVSKSPSPALVQPEAPAERLQCSAAGPEPCSPVEPELPLASTPTAPTTLPLSVANRRELTPSSPEPPSPCSDQPAEPARPLASSPAPAPKAQNGLADSGTELDSPAHEPLLPAASAHGEASLSSETLPPDARPEVPIAAALTAMAPVAVVPVSLTSSAVPALPVALPPGLPPLVQATAEAEQLKQSFDTKELAPRLDAALQAGLTDGKSEAQQPTLARKGPPTGTAAFHQHTLEETLSPSSNQTAAAIPKTWRKPNEALPAGDAPQVEDKDESRPAVRPAAEPGLLPRPPSSSPVSLLPALSCAPAAVAAEAEAKAADQNGDLEMEPLRNGAGHTSETESSDSGANPGDKDNSTGAAQDLAGADLLESNGKRQYGREFLLGFQFMPACIQKPEGLPPITDVVLDKMNQNKLPSRVVDSRAISRGPDFTPAFADFGRQMGGGRGAALLNLGARRPPPRKIIMNLSVNDDVQLKKSENAWKPGLKRESSADDPEVLKTQELFRKVRSILNKLTPQKFNQLMKQVTDLTIDTEERLKGVIDLVFEKAIDEPNFSVAYGNMCRCLATLKVPMTDKPTSSVNFRKLLLNRCQKEFEKDKVDDVVFERRQKELDSTASTTERERLQEELEEAKDKARRRSIGNIKFIGELFKLKMLTEAIMHDCVVKLLKNHDEESLECLCRLLTTIGKDLDFEKAKPRMDQYFNQMEKIVKERKTSSRIRFMLQDIIDLRLHNWVSRRADQGPKTIEQIHKEAKIEEQEEQRKVHQQLLSKDSKRRPDAREQRMQREETWNTVPMTKNSRTIDPNKIPKISKPQMDEKIQLGPRAQVTWVKGSSGGAKASDLGKVQELSRSAGLNRYSALQPTPPSQPSTAPPHTSDFESRRTLGSSRSGSGRDRNEKPPGSSSSSSRPGPFVRAGSTKELLDGPSLEEVRREREGAEPRRRSVTEDRTEPERHRVREGAKAEAVQSSGRPAMSEEEVERRSRSIIDEFLHINDYKEAVQCVEELELGPQLHVFVRVGVESTLERSQVTREHMGELLLQLLQQGPLPRGQFLQGFAETLEQADDMAIDIPHIWLYLAELLSPVLKGGGFSMRELFSELRKALLPVGKAGILISEILHILCKQMSQRTVASLWRESGLSWTDFLPEGEDVPTFITQQKLQFVLWDASGPDAAPSKRLLSPEDLGQQLHRLLLEDVASDEQIFDWVEANLDESQMSSAPFLRALMTAVCKAAVKDENSSCRVDTATIQQRLPVLLKYLNSDTERQLQALYALQELIVSLDQPPNLLRMFFDCLYDEDVISEDAFYKWESSKDPAEQKGKGVALKSVTAFFTWLREAEEESEDN